MRVTKIMFRVTKHPIVGEQADSYMNFRRIIPFGFHGANRGLLFSVNHQTGYALRAVL